MKGIVITEKNYRQVAGRLKKFFKHKNFIVWHTFNGGMRPRFSHMLKIGKYCPVDIRCKYSNIEYSINDTNKSLFIRLGYSESFSISYGDEILFLGSRIVIKTYHRRLKKYLYETFQIISE